jgi:hypothetical protein
MIFIDMKIIIISERQYNLIKEHLSEEIDPSEAYRDEDSLQTVLDGKRGVCFIAAYYPEHDDLLDIARDSGLEIISMPQDKGSFDDSTANIVYRKGFEKKALRLAAIAKKNGGYLPVKDPTETYEIGILLGYHPEKVIEFVLEKFPNFKF